MLKFHAHEALRYSVLDTFGGITVEHNIGMKRAGSFNFSFSSHVLCINENYSFLLWLNVKWAHIVNITFPDSSR